MIRQHKTTILTLLGITDLLCFVLGGFNYGEYWSVVGVAGLIALLALIGVL